MDWFLYDNGLRHERVKNRNLSDVKVKWFLLIEIVTTWLIVLKANIKI